MTQIKRFHPQLLGNCRRNLEVKVLPQRPACTFGVTAHRSRPRRPLWAWLPRRWQGLSAERAGCVSVSCSGAAAAQLGCDAGAGVQRQHCVALRPWRPLGALKPAGWAAGQTPGTGAPIPRSPRSRCGLVQTLRPTLASPRPGLGKCGLLEAPREPAGVREKTVARPHPPPPFSPSVTIHRLRRGRGSWNHTPKSGKM